MHHSARAAAVFAVIALAGSIAAQSCLMPGVETFEGASIATSTSCSNTTSFGTYPAGWSEDLTNANRVWRVLNRGTGSVGTGPETGALGSSVYVYVEASGCSNDEAILLTPCFDVSSLSNPEVAFNYHMWGANMGTLRVEQADGSGGWNVIWELSGDQGNAWITGVAAPLPTANGEVRFRIRGTVGTGFTSDMAIDNFEVREAIPQQWETNEPGARLLIDNAQVSDVFSATGGAVSTRNLSGFPGSVTGTYSFSTTGVGYEIVVNNAASVPLSGNFFGSLLPDGQIVNLDLSGGVTFTYGGVTPSFYRPVFPSLPGTSISVSSNYEITAPFQLTAQGLALDPAMATGLSLSAAAFLDVQPPLGFQFGPAGDDVSSTMSLADAGDGDFTAFNGAPVTEVRVTSNGRVFFGTGGFPDFTPSLAEAQGGDAFVGFWSDLVAGSQEIFGAVGAGGSEFVVSYRNGFIGGQGAVSFDVVLDTLSDTITIDGLSGIAPNTSSFPGTGDNQFLGLTPGAGATDPGAAGFAATGMGVAGASTDMLYEFLDVSTATTPLQLAAISGGLNGVTFTPDGTGNYTWTGF